MLTDAAPASGTEVIPPEIAKRGKPLAQFMEEQRIKHGFPDDWPNHEKYVMTEARWVLLDSVVAKFLEDFVSEPEAFINKVIG